MKRLTPSLARQIAKDFGKIKGFTFTVGSIKDLADLLRMSLACFASDQQDRQVIQYFLTKAHGAYFILRDKKGLPAGYLLLEVNQRNQSVYLNTAALLATYRGRGFGHAFYQLTDQAARRMGCKTIRQHVEAGNKINLNLAKKHGYIIVRHIKAYYDSGADCFLMRKQVRPKKKE